MFTCFNEGVYSIYISIPSNFNYILKVNVINMGFLDKIFGKKEEEKNNKEVTDISLKKENDEDLANTALNAQNYDERYDAANKIEDRDVMATVLIKTDDKEFKIFLRRFWGNDIFLGNIATNAENIDIGVKAVDRISDDNIGVLSGIVDKAKDYTVRDKASMKILKGSQLYGNGAW